MHGRKNVYRIRDKNLQNLFGLGRSSHKSRKIRDKIMRHFDYSFMTFIHLIKVSKNDKVSERGSSPTLEVKWKYFHSKQHVYIFTLRKASSFKTSRHFSFSSMIFIRNVYQKCRNGVYSKCGGQYKQQVYITIWQNFKTILLSFMNLIWWYTWKM